MTVPDDFARFEVNSAADLAGANAQRFHGTQLVDGYFGDADTPHPINEPAANGYSHTKGTGKLRVGQAIVWTFGVYKTNPKFWLAIGLVMAVLGVADQIPALAVPGLLFTIALVLLDPVFASAALQQTLTAQVDKPKSPTYGKALGVSVVNRMLVVIVGFILAAIAFVITLAVTGFDPTAFGDATNMSQEQIQEQMMNMAIAAAPGVVVGALVFALVAPFAVYPVFYAADNAGSFGFCLGEGMKAAKRNYGTTLLLLLFSLVVGVIAAIPAAAVDVMGFNVWAGAGLSFLLTVLLAPLVYLAQAHAYRQVSGGPVPHEAGLNQTGLNEATS